MNTLKAEIMKDILSKLNDYVSNNTEIEDNPSAVAFTLWERENVDGSITCSAYESKEWIKKHFDDLDEVVDEYQRETGEALNPFSSPEVFQVIITIEVTCDLINAVWEDGMTTKELIEALKELQESMGWQDYDIEVACDLINSKTYFS